MSDLSFMPRLTSARPILVGLGIVATALVGGALALWLRYGSAVFYEMILAGLAACF
ncbi:MAG: hypothetical protein HY056_17765 [Proteobacteria bacterium]|nr:hypothetical protein [Pseudomonadota bacterium]